MNRLARIIESMSEEDLKLIKKDLQAGNIERLITRKLREAETGEKAGVCPVCQSPAGEEDLILIFGPKGMRKKARFCAPDCLEYFLNTLKHDPRAGQDDDAAEARQH